MEVRPSRSPEVLPGQTQKSSWDIGPSVARTRARKSQMSWLTAGLDTVWKISQPRQNPSSETCANRKHSPVMLSLILRQTVATCAPYSARCPLKSGQRAECWENRCDSGQRLVSRESTSRLRRGHRCKNRVTARSWHPRRAGISKKPKPRATRRRKAKVAVERLPDRAIGLSRGHSQKPGPIRRR